MIFPRNLKSILPLNDAFMNSQVPGETQGSSAPPKPCRLRLAEAAAPFNTTPPAPNGFTAQDSSAGRRGQSQFIRRRKSSGGRSA